MGEASRKADDAMFRDPVLLELMTELRATAVNLKIDMTDAFSEFVPHGPEGALGIMPKNRFRAALGTIFKGAKLSDAQLKQVSIAYGTGDPDPREPGTRNRGTSSSPSTLTRSRRLRQRWSARSTRRCSPSCGC